MAQTDVPREDRNLNWRIAVVSAASALAGAFVGGLFTFIAAIHQSDSQPSEDRQTFVRSQRQDAYATLAADGQAMMAGLVECDTTAVLNDRGAADISAVELRLSKAEDALETDVGAVTIIGSGPGVSRATALQSGSRGAEASCSALLHDLSQTSTDLAVMHRDGRTLETRETEVRTDLNTFVAAAQRDVQA